MVRDQAIFEVFYGAGVRKAELIRLSLDDVNYDDGLVMVREGKGGKDRVVPIGEKGLAALRRYVRLARPLLAKGEESHLFVSLRGGVMGEMGILQCVKRTVKAAGITRNVHPHALRHCCATHMLNHGADIRYVQEFLGHASLSSTQVYTHVSISKLKQTHRRCHPREQAGFMEQAEDE
jgi:site-specific recombinase XerD